MDYPLLSHILHIFSHLFTFLAQLNLKPHQPQRRIMLNLADARLVCKDSKTIAALQRQFVEAPDASKIMVDYLRISSWQAAECIPFRKSSLVWLGLSSKQHFSQECCAQIKTYSENLFCIVQRIIFLRIWVEE